MKRGKHTSPELDTKKGDRLAPLPLEPLPPVSLSGIGGTVLMTRRVPR